MDCRVKPGNDGEVRIPRPESRLIRTTINPAWRCQCPRVQGSSEGLNIRSQTVISALQRIFPVRK
jgi:hypothetical protein